MPNTQNQRTYQIAAPRSTHFRRASCAEVECANHERGWVTVVDESTELGQRQAAYIRRECRSVLSPATIGLRRYTEARTPAGWTEFTFGSGQNCFSQHELPIERPQLFIVRNGWAKPRRHDRPEHWVEDCQTHTDRLGRLRQRG